MNIVRYDGKEYFDYAKYWVAHDINISLEVVGLVKVIPLLSMK